MKSLAENQVLLLSITFILYYGVLLLQKKYNSVFLNPVLITVLVLISYLIIFDISPEKYEEAGQYIYSSFRCSVVFANLKDKETTYSIGSFSVCR